MKTTTKVLTITSAALALLAQRLVAASARPPGSPAAFIASLDGERQLLALTTTRSSRGDVYVLSLHGNALAPAGLDTLGLDVRTLVAIRALLERPSGWLAVASADRLDGERVVRALAQQLVSPERKLLCVEPSPHPPLPRVVQVDASAATEALVADSIPDVDAVLVPAHLPDATLAALAARAAEDLLVVHRSGARRPSEVLGRLLGLGLAPGWAARSLSGVLMRYRVRLLCPCCRVADPGESEARRWLGALRTPQISDVSAWLERALETRCRPGEGCEACHGSAHSGVRDLTDIVLPDETLRRTLWEGDIERALVLVDASSRLAAKLGALVADGTICADEAARHLRPRY